MENAEVPFFPDLKVNPEVAPRVSVPFVTERVSVSVLAPAFVSATEIALPLAVEKLSEGIRKFYADSRKLEEFSKTLVAEKVGA